MARETQVPQPEDASAPAPARSFDVTLPPLERGMVELEYSSAGVILEYGSGGSTFLALDLGARTVFSVESDAAWARDIAAALADRHPGRDARIHHVDIGETKAWGAPIDDRHWRRFHRYPLEVWDRKDFVHPDVILIDGRFRVACFLTAMLRVRRKTTVLFDDYIGRQGYHYVETFARPVAVAGRMARFEIGPAPLPPEHLTGIIARFNVVN